jgi:hypothetical protein
MYGKANKFSNPGREHTNSDVHGRRNIRTQLIKSEEDRITFGKFRGFMFKDVLDNHKPYIDWLIRHGCIRVLPSIYSIIDKN